MNKKKIAIFPIKKKKNVIKIQTFFRFYAIIKKVLANSEKSQFYTKKRPDFEIRSIDDTRINAKGEFFTNKPKLKKNEIWKLNI